LTESFPQNGVALFGGSFNPVHRAHVALVQGLLEMPHIDQVVVIPAFQSPFKTDQPMLPAPLRQQMLQRALAHLPEVSLYLHELERKEPSYSYATVQALAKVYPNRPLWWVMGQDAAQGFSGWKKADALLELASLLVIPRSQHVADQEAPLFWEAEMLQTLLPKAWKSPTFVQMAPVWGQKPALKTQNGRWLVCQAAIHLPALSATQIRQSAAGQELSNIPPAAQPLYQAYLENGEVPK